MRRWFLSWISILLLVQFVAAQTNHSAKTDHSTRPFSEADFAQHASDSVVQVLAMMEHKPLPDDLPADVKNCFRLDRCIVGTGSLVDEAGDVITAAHVARDTQQLVAALYARGVRAAIGIGVISPNYEDSITHIAAAGAGFNATITAIDPLHDVALLHVDGPIKVPTAVVREGAPAYPKANPTPIRFAINRLRDTEPVFACGYPMYSPNLVTTSGTIATSWNTRLLETAKANGSNKEIDVYEADLRTNPGNSGGPVFRSSDGAVIGTSVEVSPGRPGLTVGLTVIVPSKYLTEFLTVHGIKWLSAEPAPAERKK